MTKPMPDNGTMMKTYSSNNPRKVSQSASKSESIPKPLYKLIIVSSILLVIVLTAFEFRYVVFEYLSLLHIVKLDLNPKHGNGGWREPDEATLQLYDTGICNIDRVNAVDLTLDIFESTYRHRKPVIVTFPNGAEDWINPGKWTVESLKTEYGDRWVLSGNAREIVRRGGSGYVETTFEEYLNDLLNESDQIGEPFYVFDRDFYNNSYLPDSLKPPPYFKIQDGVDDSIFFLGSSGSGVSFHKHADAWNGVIFGRKKWFLYTPESVYHGTVNLGDTIAIGIQKKEAVTEVEKIFYTERKLVESMRGLKEDEKKKAQENQLKLLKSLLHFIPENAEVHMRIGELYSELNDFVQAENHLNKARQLDKFFLIATLNLASVKQKMVDPHAAESLYRECMHATSKLWDVYAQYGDFLLAQGRPKEAAEIYRKGIELEPNSLAFWHHLRYAHEVSGNLEDARETQKIIDEMKLVEITYDIDS
ncbi:JMJD8-like protein [Mya arenaria]|uniref:JMJD8-like protein n=1 Tax=Mya arenaria TaxID=6604 RepID=A0ABY7FYK7_MYAAR|nr:JMJD8-like protein [Mya arenaria]